MQNINKVGKPGDIFINRAGKECIWVASDGIGKYKYRFRLLSEHKMREKECDYVNNTLENVHLKMDINKRIFMDSISVWGIKEYVYDTGDWYVRFNGCITCCSKWEEPLDIVKKKDI